MCKWTLLWKKLWESGLDALRAKSRLSNQTLAFSISVATERTGYRTSSERKKGMLLERLIFTDQSTLGEISMDGQYFCKCLELSCRKGDEGGRLAIDPGRYEIKITYSPRFKRDTAEIMNVPGRTGIRFHPANYYTQLDGCVAPGFRTETNSIFESVKANDALHAEIKRRLAVAPLYISIVGGRPGVSH